nr:hypothetical protein [Tanacetum cinerariifolium]
VSDDELEAPEAAPQSSGQAPPSLDYVPGPENPPSPDYVPGSEYPEGGSRRGPEEDPVGYPTDGGDDDEDDEEDEEEEEHLAMADYTTLPAVGPVPSAEDTEAFETGETAPTPPSPPTHTSPTYSKAPIGYKAAMIRSRATSPPHVPSHRLYKARILSPPLPLPSLPLPLPTPSSPLLLPASDRREDVPEADVPPRKRLCFTASAPRFKVGRVWDDMVGDMEGRAPTTLEELSQRVTDLAATLARDTREMYVRFEDA